MLVGMTYAAPLDALSADLPHLQVKIRRIPREHPSNALSMVDLFPGQAGVQEGESLWCGHRRQMIGWGEAWRLAVVGRQEIRRAARLWEAMCASANVVCECEPQCDAVDMPTVPIAFASFAFSDQSEGFITLPQVVIVEEGMVKDDRGRWGFPWAGLGAARGTRFVVTTALGEDPVDPRAVIDALPVAPWRERVGKVSAGELTTAPGRMTQEQWTEHVARVIEELRGGAAQKVVMSRDMLVLSSVPIDQRLLIDRLVELYPTTWAYTVGGLVGATPEMLAAVRGGRVASRVLAGTTAPGGGEALMESSKDRQEHRFAVESVSQALSPMTRDLQVPAEPTVLDLPNVTHLATDIVAELVGGNVVDVIASVHPSAAVCGTPTDRAYALLERYEATERGRYAGPVGWVDGAGEGEFGLALRCGLVSRGGGELRLFAGGGIMPDSRPEVELAETRAKMAPLLQALGLC